MTGAPKPPRTGEVARWQQTAPLVACSLGTTYHSCGGPFRLFVHIAVPACRWFDDPQLAASFDLVVLYFGNSSSFACPRCLHVFRRPRATKYQLLAGVLFSGEWAQLVAARGPWSRLWLPDDDVLASACDIARLFWLMDASGLELAQMSVCRVGGTWVFWPSLFQRPGIALRYTPFVEIMAPAFSFSFFQAVVRPTLVHSFTGWGLDTVWPYLLGYPQDAVGVADAVCMTHNGTAGLGLWAPGNHTSSNYAAAEGAAAYEDAWQEERHVVHQLWRISPYDLWNAGVPSDPVARFVHEFWNVPLLPAAAEEAAGKPQQLPQQQRQQQQQQWPQQQQRQPPAGEQQWQMGTPAHSSPTGGHAVQPSATLEWASFCPPCKSCDTQTAEQKGEGAAAAAAAAGAGEAAASEPLTPPAGNPLPARRVTPPAVLIAAAALAAACLLSWRVLERHRPPGRQQPSSAAQPSVQRRCSLCSGPLFAACAFYLS
ncbi:hypothetical protein ABPG77_001657 [Micractinium sp. CCAP 211/92]